MDPGSGWVLNMNDFNDRSVRQCETEYESHAASSEWCPIEENQAWQDRRAKKMQSLTGHNRIPPVNVVKSGLPAWS